MQGNGKGFIGGSGGRLREILGRLLVINPNVRVTANAVSLETLDEAVKTMTKMGMEPEIVSISIAKAKKAGNHHMMLGQNPVFIITGGRNPIV